jgi:hypothetical protein
LNLFVCPEASSSQPQKSHQEPAAEHSEYAALIDWSSCLQIFVGPLRHACISHHIGCQFEMFLDGQALLSLLRIPRLPKTKQLRQRQHRYRPRVREGRMWTLMWISWDFSIASCLMNATMRLSSLETCSSLRPCEFDILLVLSAPPR